MGREVSLRSELMPFDPGVKGCSVILVTEHAGPPCVLGDQVVASIPSACTWPLAFSPLSCAAHVTFLNLRPGHSIFPLPQHPVSPAVPGNPLCEPPVPDRMFCYMQKLKPGLEHGFPHLHCSLPGVEAGLGSPEHLNLSFSYLNTSLTEARAESPSWILSLPTHASLGFPPALRECWHRHFCAQSSLPFPTGIGFEDPWGGMRKVFRAVPPPLSCQLLRVFTVVPWGPIPSRLCFLNGTLAWCLAPGGNLNVDGMEARR